MIAVDTNILVYAHRGESPHFLAAQSALFHLAEARENWAIPWPCVHAFLAVVTNLRGIRRPSTAEEAIAKDASCPNVSSATSVVPSRIRNVSSPMASRSFCRDYLRRPF